MIKLGEALERFFRKSIVYPLLRTIFRNPVSVTPIDLSRVERMLILRYDRIGDMIITTPILRTLKKLNPRLKLDVLASRSNAEIVRQNPFVDNLLIIEENWLWLLRQILDLRKQRYDVVLNLIFNRTTGPGILANLIAPRADKIGQGSERYAFYFNRLVKVRRFEQHMLESLVSLIEQAFGISVNRQELAFEIAVAPASRREVDGWLEKRGLHRRSQLKSPGSPYVVLNLSAKEAERSLVTHQAAALAKSLSGKSEFCLVVLDSPGNGGMSEALRIKPEFQKSLVYRTRSPQPLGELASLIEGALLVISPDTSIVHFASAMQTPILAIHTPMTAPREWLPHNVRHDVVMADEGQRVSEIGPQVLVEKAERFIARILQTTVPYPRS